MESSTSGLLSSTQAAPSKGGEHDGAALARAVARRERTGQRDAVKEACGETGTG